MKVIIAIHKDSKTLSNITKFEFFERNLGEKWKSFISKPYESDYEFKLMDLSKIQVIAFKSIEYLNESINNTK